MSFDDELRLLQIKDKIYRSLIMHINQTNTSLYFIIEIFNVLMQKYPEDAVFIDHLRHHVCSPNNNSIHTIMNSLLTCYNYNLLNDLNLYVQKP